MTDLPENFYAALGLDASVAHLFHEHPWPAFSDALGKRAVRTVTEREGLLLWLLVMRLRPKAVLELGGQHGHSGIILADAVRRTGGTFVTVELGDDPRNDYEEASRGTLEFLPDGDPQVVKVWGEAEEQLPRLLAGYDVGMVFHDCAHTWGHVEACVRTVLGHDPTITQACHDAATGVWEPGRETRYGRVCAERPVFDKYFEGNPDYLYLVLEDRYGVAVAVHRESI